MNRINELLADLKNSGKTSKEATDAIRFAEEFISRPTRYSNEDCDIRQMLLSALTCSWVK